MNRRVTARLANSKPAGSSVIALAGRRVDAPGTHPPHFPLDRVGSVADRLRSTFRGLKAETLVCSAANGADLVALRIARELGMRRRIVLPFAATRFRDASVTDRPGSELWGWLFDDLVARAREEGDLVVLSRRSESTAYAAANERIIQEALRVAGGGGADDRGRVEAALAVVVWEGDPHGKDDATAAFAELARSAGLPVKTISTHG
jgi:hypothetical protein